MSLVQEASRPTQHVHNWRQWQQIAVRTVVTLFFVILVILAIFPFYWMIVSSIRPSTLIFAEASKLLPSEVTLANYQELFAEIPYGRWYINSLILSSGYTVLSLLLCTMGGFALAKYQFPFRNSIFFTILGSQMIPFHLLLIPLFITLVNYRLIDTYIGAIVPLIAHPFGLFYMRQYMLGLSEDILDAARVDGASEYRIFSAVVLPLVKPAIGALSILFALEMWNNLLWPLVVMRSADKFPLAVGIASLLGQYRPQYHLVMAAAFLASFPIIVLFLFMQNQFITGMSASGMVVEK